MIDQGSTVGSDAAAPPSTDKRAMRARSPLSELRVTREVCEAVVNPKRQMVTKQEVAKQATATLQPYQMSKQQCIDELHRLNAWFGAKPKSCSDMNLAELRDHLEKTRKLKLQPISQFFEMRT